MRSSRPSLLDTLTHAAVLRALASFQGQACIALDATAGNGHDTCFLADALRTHAGATALTLACDVQESAVTATRHRLEAAGLSAQAHVHLCGHEQAVTLLPPGQPLAVVMFNLGYLPGGDKSRTTTAATTLQAMRALCARLADNGVMTLHCYTGHTNGAAEAEAVAAFSHTLPPRRWRVICCTDSNRDTREERVFLLEKLPERHR